MNELKHLAEFQNVLSGYQMSEQSRKILLDTRLALLLAPTSTGRNTIIRELLKTGNYYFIISDTTRRPRTNDGVAEQDGVEYWFRSEEEVLKDLKSGKYLEAEIIHNQQVSGMSIREIEKTRDQDKIGVTDIDIKGMENVLSAKPDAAGILLLPPSYDEWQRRIDNRGDMESNEYRRRLETASRIFKMAGEDKRLHIVVNDDLGEAVRMIDEIATKGTCPAESQERGRELAAALYQATSAYLKTFEA